MNGFRLHGYCSNAVIQLKKRCLQSYSTTKSFIHIQLRTIQLLGMRFSGKQTKLSLVLSPGCNIHVVSWAWQHYSCCSFPLAYLYSIFICVTISDLPVIFLEAVSFLFLPCIQLIFYSICMVGAALFTSFHQLCLH